MNVVAGTGADGNGNRVVDAADYVVWRNNFTTASNAASTGIPEPDPATLVLIALISLATIRRFNTGGQFRRRNFR